MIRDNLNINEYLKCDKFIQDICSINEIQQFHQPSNEIEIDAQLVLPIDTPIHILLRPTNLTKTSEQGLDKWRRMMIIFHKVRDEIWANINIQPECDGQGSVRRYESNCIKTLFAGR